ncbi:hypothetical protein [Helicobacter sp.]|uniref:hypothetical protein n=1 Tax=Helicobacter sp. TaxID=218 RepID=UPI0019C1E5D7|nr:hypothetical protein [Helicobacter sp.]MBD5165276.1 hypothetical protein [Helicobacter sp.]
MWNLKNKWSQSILNKNLGERGFIVSASLIPIPFIVLLVINLYLYDPAQIFHKPYFRKITFFDDMRVAARGIIQHYHFDSYILGTSMLENTSAKEAKKKLGGEWVNISLSGSTFNERAVVLEYLFKHQSPKQILYSLDYLVSVQTRNDMPIKLYNDSNADDFSFYINDRFVVCSLIWSKDKGCVGKSDSGARLEDSIVRWIDFKDYIGRFGGIENWVKFKNHEQLKEPLRILSQYEIQNLKENFIAEDLNAKIRENITENILKFVKQNQQTRFYFVIPPYSRLNYKLNSRFGGNFLQFQSTLSWFVLELEKYPNATLYGFDNLDYADEIANYKDLTHYNIDMNSMQLDAIRENTHRLTQENIEGYLKAMESKIQEYEIESLIKIVKEALGE